MNRSVEDRISDIQQAISRCRQFAIFSSDSDPIILATQLAELDIALSAWIGKQ